MAGSDGKRLKLPMRQSDKEALFRELREAGKNMTPADRKAQQLSYVIGCVAGDDKNAQEKVRQYLEETHSPATGPSSS